MASRVELQREVPKANFDIWVKGIELLTVEDDTFVFVVQNTYTRDWLEQ